MSAAAQPNNSPLELLKSVLVIPVSAAMVLGIAWGLVQWANWRLLKSGRSDPQPAQIAADGSLALQLPFAQIGGDIVYEGGTHPSLGNWKLATDSISWHFQVPKPGRYAVDLLMAGDAASEGAEIEIDVSGKKLTATLGPAPAAGKTQTIRTAEIEIRSAGWNDLRMAAKSIPEGAALKLRGVRLAPAEKPS